MYRSLYNYQGKDKGSMSVRAGDKFVFIQQHDANWWKMRSQTTGSVGLVPACYLEAVDKETVREFMVKLQNIGLHFTFYQTTRFVC